MFQYQDLMIALPTPLEGLLIWVGTTDYLTENLDSSVHWQPAQPSKQQIFLLHTCCRILLGLFLTCPIYSRGTHFHVSGSFKNVQFVRTYFLVCILPCLEGTVAVICEYCV